MSHWLLPILLGIFFVLLLFAAWQLSRLGRWFIIWARGCAIVGSVALAACLLMLAYELARFDTVNDRTPLVMLSVKTVDSQSFLVEIKDADGALWYTSLTGDAWQLKVRGLTFKGIASTLTSAPVARPISISNRYYDFAKRDASRTVTINPSAVDATLMKLGINSWSILSSIDPVLNLLGIHRGEELGSIIPLTDGALYQIRWARNYIRIDPGNAVAQESLQTPE